MVQTGITIETVGVFRVFAPDGTDLTPAGTRSRAILAVIALSHRRAVSRRWLEALIWADRAQEQASGSLRQALSGIRRGLAGYSDLLTADRSEISLADNGVAIDFFDHPEQVRLQIASGRDLLEGLDIRSEPFEDWLRLERARFRALVDPARVPAAASGVNGMATPPTTAAGLVLAADAPRLFTHSSGATSPLAAFFAETVEAQLGQTVSEHVRTDVILLDGEATSAILAPGAQCAIRVVETDGRIRVVVRMSLVPSGRLIWSRNIAFDATDEQGALDATAALAFEASEAMAMGMDDAKADNAAQANAMAATALKHVFSFDPQRLEFADKLLEQANDLFPHAPRPALRGLAKSFLSVERSDQGPDQGALQEDARRLIDEALNTDASNPLALAFIADVYDLVFKNPEAALSATERALSINPGTGYAYASLGALELRQNRPREAFAASLRAKSQLEHTSLQVFALMRFCVAAMSAGRFHEAAEAAERASHLAPGSRPPLRHLYALRLGMGDHEGARAALRSLHQLEPDFSLDRLRQDPDFPAETLRRTGFVKLRDVDM